MSAEETFTNMNLPKYQFAIDKITEKNWDFVDTLCMYVFYYRYYNYRSKSIETKRTQTNTQKTKKNKQKENKKLRSSMSVRTEWHRPLRHRK